MQNQSRAKSPAYTKPRKSSYRHDGPSSGATSSIGDVIGIGGGQERKMRCSNWSLVRSNGRGAGIVFVICRSMDSGGGMLIQQNILLLIRPMEAVGSGAVVAAGGRRGRRARS